MVLPPMGMLDLAIERVRHSAARQEVIATNIAHADTPGYRARDLADFDTILREGAGFRPPRLTRPGHVAFDPTPAGWQARPDTTAAAPNPNGNTVSLEDQMMRAASLRHDHDMAMGVWRKSLEIMRLALGR